MLCPWCLQPVVLELGEVKAACWRHREGDDCISGERESDEHRAAKQRLFEFLRDCAPRTIALLHLCHKCGSSCRRADLDVPRGTVLLERAFGSVRPDVAIERDGSCSFAFEVVHTNPVSARKARTYLRDCVPWVEVDARAVLATERLDDGLPMLRRDGEGFRLCSRCARGPRHMRAAYGEVNPGVHGPPPCDDVHVVLAIATWHARRVCGEVGLSLDQALHDWERAAPMLVGYLNRLAPGAERVLRICAFRHGEARVSFHVLRMTHSGLVLEAVGLGSVQVGTGLGRAEANARVRDRLSSGVNATARVMAPQKVGRWAPRPGVLSANDVFGRSAARFPSEARTEPLVSA